MLSKTWEDENSCKRLCKGAGFYRRQKAKWGRRMWCWSREFDREAQEHSGLSKQSVHALAEEKGRRYS